MRTYIPLKDENCKNDMPIKVDLLFPKTASDFGLFSGNVSVGEDIFGDIDFVLESTQCSIDLKVCKKNNNFNFKGVCKTFKEKHAFYSPFLNSFKPNFDCPIRAGNYTLPETSIDLAFAKIFPIEGYIFIETWKWVATDRKTKVKRTVMCYCTEVKIISINKRNLK